MNGLGLIREERRRQVEIEGWTAEHDRAHMERGDAPLEMAAISYLTWGDSQQPPSTWPWAASWWKPKDRLRNLVRAGALFQAAGEASDPFIAMRYWGMRALVAAEIDRLQLEASRDH